MIIGVLHGLEPDAFPARESVHVRRAVAHGQDVGQARAAVWVHIDAVGDGGARRQERARRWRDADTHDHHLAADRLAVGQAHPADRAVPAFYAGHRRPQAQVDAPGAVLLFVKTGQVFARDPCEHAGRGLQQGDRLAQLGQDRCRLEPDIAAPDHHDTGDTVQFAQQSVDVRTVPHRMDPGEIAAGAGETSRGAAGRPDQLAVEEGGVVGKGRHVSLRIDGDDPSAEQHRDVLVAPECRRPDQNPLERLIAGEIVLRQRGALVGKIVFFGHDGDRPAKAALPEGYGRLRAAMAAADDQNIEVTIGHFEPVTDARTAAIHRRFIVVRYYQLRNA